MSSGGVNRTAVGNTSNQLMNTISQTGGQFNDQLQSLLGTSITSPLSGAGASALSGYQDIATTGGYSPEQISAMKAEGSDAARSAYSTAGDQFKRSVAASGGYGPSGDATASLARQGGEAASRAAVNTDAAIAGSQAQNRLSALGGQANLAGLNAAQQQQLLNTILGNVSNTESQENETLRTQAGIARMPGAEQYIWNGILQAISGSKAGSGGWQVGGG